jgi:hypothetical protein
MFYSSLLSKILSKKKCTGATETIKHVSRNSLPFPTVLWVDSNVLKEPAATIYVLEFIGSPLYSLVLYAHEKCY